MDPNKLESFYPLRETFFSRHAQDLVVALTEPLFIFELTNSLYSLIRSYMSSIIAAYNRTLMRSSFNLWYDKSYHLICEIPIHISENTYVASLDFAIMNIHLHKQLPKTFELFCSQAINHLNDLSLLFQKFYILHGKREYKWIAKSRKYFEKQDLPSVFMFTLFSLALPIIDIILDIVSNIAGEKLGMTTFLEETTKIIKEIFNKAVRKVTRREGIKPAFYRLFADTILSDKSIAYKSFFLLFTWLLYMRLIFSHVYGRMVSGIHKEAISISPDTLLLESYKLLDFTEKNYPKREQLYRNIKNMLLPATILEEYIARSFRKEKIKILDLDSRQIIRILFPPSLYYLRQLYSAGLTNSNFYLSLKPYILEAGEVFARLRFLMLLCMHDYRQIAFEIFTPTTILEILIDENRYGLSEIIEIVYKRLLSRQNVFIEYLKSLKILDVNKLELYIKDALNNIDEVLDKSFAFKFSAGILKFVFEEQLTGTKSVRFKNIILPKFPGIIGTLALTLKKQY